MVIAVPWWFYALAAVPALMPTLSAFLGRRGASQMLSEVGVRQISQMSWQQFERFVIHLFSELGYRVERAPYWGDYGANLIVTMPGGLRVAVQAKQLVSDVGMRSVQEAHGAASVYKCHHSMIITTRGYTDAARKTADATGTILWGMKEIVEALDNARLVRQRRHSRGWARVA